MHVVLLLGSPYKKLEPWLETGIPVTKQHFFVSYHELSYEQTPA